MKFAKVMVGFFLIFLTLKGNAKVYDCFLFFNEIELLKIRLEELYDYVDYFVLVESSETFRGHPKPFYFEENKPLFQKYMSKIIHVKVDETMPSWGVWEREAYQRNAILKGLAEAQSKDVILISDLDEIPRHSMMPLLRKKIKKGTPAMVLEQKIYFFQLNRRTPSGLSWDNNYWFGTTVASLGYLKKMGGPDRLRTRGRQEKMEKVFNAGWHFTYMGGQDYVKAKIQSFSHGQDDVSYITDDVFASYLSGHPAVPLDETFPQYVRDHREYYQSLGFIAEVN